MSRIVLFGTGQLASVAHFYLTHDSEHEVAAFTVDAAYATESSFEGLPVVAFEEVEQQYPPDEFQMLLPISYQQVNHLRARKYSEAKAKGYTLISYVSSLATTWPGLKLGDNCMIFEHNVIQPFVEIGDDVILWSGNHIGHHTSIGDHCFLASHVVVSGSVRIEPYCFVGVNATIRDNVTIGEAAIVGAGALVLKNIEERGVYVGTAGNRLNRRSDELRRI